MSTILSRAKGAAVAGMVAGAGLAVRVLAPWSAEAAMPGHEMTGDPAGRSPLPVAAAANEVVIDNFSFEPTNLSVAVGTKVVWTNDDSDAHAIVSEGDPKVFKSPPLDTGDSFAFTFDKPGTYKYMCSIHPRMRGTITVQ